ncbi:sugar nucleotide-binding protein [Undibacterium sp. LX40W]|uniref:Sugar nucleotide-binding protein n=1 Tax=Undibacterium nitidum TaxID=2762298 RepID=A0A923HIN7_9BURK|nr:MULTISPECIES: NAD-dependent epimerase/dehydratase family protein [Undibacterium]MBC3880114.1 sugar nucleotide-binding protein [Undibacterium nitidum]MBC3891150.1 sugar nucleotide-binding protein [Undibacterium sp. LX40W]
MKLSSSPVARFAKPRILIIGCGDVGMRLLPMLVHRFRVFAVTSQVQGSARFSQLRAAGATPIYADLDQTHTLRKLAGLAPTVIHLAPPPQNGSHDPRTKRLAAILPEKTRLVYISTTGVYGDCSGALFDETRSVNPVNARAKRRVDAEQCLRAWATRQQSRLSILRVPGIYAEDRLPVDRLQKGTPALCEKEDVFTNHIHANDLAYLSKLALFRGRPNRVYHAVDDSAMKMGDYFDLVASYFQMTKPQRLSRKDLALVVSPMLLSFMSESRRLKNERIKIELGAQLMFPTVEVCLQKMKERGVAP